MGEPPGVGGLRGGWRGVGGWGGGGVGGCLVCMGPRLYVLKVVVTNVGLDLARAVTVQKARVCSEKASPMALKEREWRFFDFHSVQLLQDCESGQTLCVHGTVFPALYDDGPFRCVSYKGRPLLLQKDGNDDTRSFHFADEHFVWTVGEKFAPEFDKAVVFYTHKDGGTFWGTDIWCQHTGHCLSLPVPEFPEFKCEFFWYTVSSTCGVEPVLLWCNFVYILSYMGFSGELTSREAEQIREHVFGEFDLDGSHLVASMKAKKWRLG
jgi:hypothetical protein